MKKLIYLIISLVCIFSGIRGYSFYNRSFYPDFSKFAHERPDFKNWIFISRVLNPLDSNLIFRYRYDAVESFINKAQARKNFLEADAGETFFNGFEFMISRRINPDNCLTNHGCSVKKKYCSNNTLYYYFTSKKNNFICLAWEFDSETGAIVKSNIKSRWQQIFENMMYFIKGDSVNLTARLIMPLKNNYEQMFSGQYIIKKDLKGFKDLHKILATSRDYIRTSLNKDTCNSGLVVK